MFDPGSDGSTIICNLSASHRFPRMNIIIWMKWTPTYQADHCVSDQRLLTSFRIESPLALFSLILGPTVSKEIVLLVKRFSFGFQTIEFRRTIGFSLDGRCFCHSLYLASAVHSPEQGVCLPRVHGKACRGCHHSRHDKHCHCVVFFFRDWWRATCRSVWRCHGLSSRVCFDKCILGYSRASFWFLNFV